MNLKDIKILRLTESDNDSEELQELLNSGYEIIHTDQLISSIRYVLEKTNHNNNYKVVEISLYNEDLINQYLNEYYIISCSQRLHDNRMRYIFVKYE